MVTHSGDSRGIRNSVLVAVALLFLVNPLLQNVAGIAYFCLAMQSNATVTSPPVVLHEGTAGSSHIYANSTSAKVSAAASATYDYVLKIANQASDSWKIRLRAYSQTNLARLSNCTIYFHNDTNGTSGQIYIVSGSYTQQTGPWYDLPSSPAERYVVLFLSASNSEVSYIYVYLDILVPNKTTYAQYILTFEIT
jgi:hypothetical protein